MDLHEYRFCMGCINFVCDYGILLVGSRDLSVGSGFSECTRVVGIKGIGSPSTVYQRPLEKMGHVDGGRRSIMLIMEFM